MIKYRYIYCNSVAYGFWQDLPIMMLSLPASEIIEDLDFDNVQYLVNEEIQTSLTKELKDAIEQAVMWGKLKQ